MTTVTGDKRWDVLVLESKEKAWGEKSAVEKVSTVALLVLKVVLAIGLVYLFIIALDMMGAAFTILGGPTAGKTFRHNKIFSNPFAGLVIGILATVLVQSSSTSTSIVISMTAAHLLRVNDAIFMIMGANIGTSVTNTIVSLAHFGKKDEYRRAFAGATVHDCFNILTVCVLLPVEAITGVLRRIATAIVNGTLEDDQEKAQSQDFLKKITKPVAERLIQVDKKLVTAYAAARTDEDVRKLEEKSMVQQKRDKPNHLFMDTPMSDDAAGWLLVFVSLALLTVCLSLLVKMLQSIFRGRAAIWMQSILNLEFKRVPFVADYILVLFGVGITILMQSSSITTSTLTPLVGVGLIKLDKMFAFTVGANIGTTITGILSALASSDIKTGMKVALAHLEFNIIGMLIWFPIIPIRAIPLSMAKFLGDLAADLPWFPVAYIAVVFLGVPALLLGLSLAGAAVFGIFGALFLIAFIALIVVIYLRRNRADKLPEKLRQDREWMPRAIRAAPAAEAEEETTNTGPAQGSVDMGGPNQWVLSPFAWGMAWLAVLFALPAVPNCQWGNLKYAVFDPREHVGIGAWSACSAQFEDAMDFASSPGSCTEAQARMCWGWKMSSCGAGGYANVPGVNEEYEDSWNNCTAQFQCTPQQWEAVCLEANCGGSGHRDQCRNLTEIVKTRSGVRLSYPGGQAWNSGDKCRPVKELCDNHEKLGHAGNLGVTGLIFEILGLITLLAYLAIGKKKPVFKFFLVASAGLFAFTWLMLLASWAAFAGAVDGDAECILVDTVTRKAVKATGRFGDMINSAGSYSFAFVIASWCLLTFTIPLLVLRIIHDVRQPTEKDSDAAPAAGASTSV